MLSRFRQSMSEGLKSITLWSGSVDMWPGWREVQGGRTDYRYGHRGLDYARDVGDIWSNATAMACIGWMQRHLTKVPFEVTKMGPDGKPAPIPDHDLTKLLKNPNPYYSGKHLLKATISDYMATGNAYWYKNERDMFRAPTQLVYLPAHTLRPIPDRRKFISHYAYRVDGKTIDLPPEDIVHFRFSLNPHHPWLGLTPWMAGLIHLSADTRGAIFNEALVRNAGAVGLIVSPKDKEIILEKADADAIKDKLDATSQGHNAGSNVVLHGSSDISKLAFSPEEMALERLLSGPADVICALVGLSTLLLALPGSENTRTYANLAEARQAAIEGNVDPTLDLMGDDLDLQLLTDFEKPDSGLSCDFDTTKLPEMQEDETAKWTRVNEAVSKHRTLTPNEARAAMGYGPITGGDEVQKPPVPSAFGANGPDPNADPNAPDGSGKKPSK